MTVLTGKLEAVSLRARPYPAHLLPEGGTGLVLFAAAFMGHNDAIHFARKEMTATCVDRDRFHLRQMSRLYPQGWEFVHADAWHYAQQAADEGRRWDAVSADTYLGEAAERSLRSLELWCSLADRIVTATIPASHHGADVPDGWSAFLLPRSDNASWLVLTR